MKIFAALLDSVAALAFASAPAFAQVTPPKVPAMTAGALFPDIPNGQVYPTNYYASALQLRSFILGQNSQHLSAPTLTTSTSVCGGSTATVSGTDLSGQIAEGTTASTSCVVTFATAFATAPECFVSINGVADTALKCAATTTALTITQTSASSNAVNYLVVALPGG